MLVVLEVVVGSEVGRQIKIPQDRTCKVGRTNYSDEAFTDDVMMSGQHFEIRNDGKYCWLRDLESRNGTRVDDDFVKESLVIRDGQKVFAGRTEFLVKIDGGAKSPYESTSVGTFEPVRNRSLMSTTFGSQVYAEDDPRFPKSEKNPQGNPQPLPPGAPAGPPMPPVMPTPPPSGVPQHPSGGNMELPPTPETPKFPRVENFSPPEFAKPDTGTAPGHPPGFPPAGSPPPPGPASQGTSKSPPWAHPAPTPVTPGQPMPGQVIPGQLPSGSPPPSHQEFTPPHKRGGDEGPIFKFAKGSGGPASAGPPPGMPPSFRHTPGTPPGSPPAGDPRFQTPPHAEPPAVSGAPPSFETPGQPPQEKPTNFAAPPERPLPPGTPPGPPGTPPGGFPNFDEPAAPPQFSSFASPPLPHGTEPPEHKGPPGTPHVAPWEAQGGGKNPNLDFGSDDFGPNVGPALDFGDEADDEDEPLFGPPSFAGGSGPSFTNQMGPAGGNPNLVDFSFDQPPGNKVTGPPSEDEPLPPTGIPQNVIEPAPPTPSSNWRNPDYVSAAPPPSQIDEGEQNAAAASPDSVRGLCFQEETADSGYPVYHSIIEGVPKVPFSPFALIHELSKVAKPVLSIHFMRAEMQIPENLEGTPLRGDLDAKFAALGGPMLYCPQDLEPFREIINELWGLDAISCMFTSGDPQGVVDHFRQGLFAPKRGDLPTPGPGPQFFAVFSPNLLTTFLSQRDQETVDELLGTEVVGVLAEVADMPESWQLFTKKSWAESLKKLGMNRVVEQPQ
ncbi:FHA domain protein [Bremerella volcania]|uniref:FHA domain protein n=1 Tax=Bremerella volcania TaxID=2527984 RepID=A0A518C3N7_9BACT|nr:FHA domain-containing protein [Bremerella volcania]QDU73833.1 FHA domain protein [Bremerella volcania]